MEYRAEHFLISEAGTFPNNGKLPVVVYRSVLDTKGFFSGFHTRQIFRKNHWTNSWKNGIYTFHHYHSNTHEAMGVLKGKTSLILGGDSGKVVSVEEGDVIIIPAGVAHMNLGKEDDVVCIGAYPAGRSFNMRYGRPEERPMADHDIQNVPVPFYDPVFGEKGEVTKVWKK